MAEKHVLLDLSAHTEPATAAINELAEEIGALRKSIADHFMIKRSNRAQHYRDKGWDDMAEVIETQEGKHIVRNGLKHIVGEK